MSVQYHDIVVALARQFACCGQAKNASTDNHNPIVLAHCEAVQVINVFREDFLSERKFEIST